MSMRNPYEKYRNNAVFTASGEELTLMLYDGALKFCNQASIAMGHKDVPKTHELILKVQNIIREFQITLDKKYDVANQLDQLYIYMHERLVEANLKKDLAILEEVTDLLRDLRDTWKDAMKLAKQSPVAKNGAKAGSGKTASGKVADSGQAPVKSGKVAVAEQAVSTTQAAGQGDGRAAVAGQSVNQRVAGQPAAQAVMGVPITKKAQMARQVSDVKL